MAAASEARVTELINQAIDHYQLISRAQAAETAETVVKNALTQYDERMTSQVLAAGREVLDRSTTESKSLETKLREDLKEYCGTLQKQLGERLEAAEEKVNTMKAEAEVLRGAIGEAKKGMDENMAHYQSGTEGMRAKVVELENLNTVIKNFMQQKEVDIQKIWSEGDLRVRQLVAQAGGGEGSGERSQGYQGGGDGGRGRGLIDLRL